MASAARAYREPLREADYPTSQPHSRAEVSPMKKVAGRQENLNPVPHANILAVVKVGIAIAFIIALACIARVWFTAAAVDVQAQTNVTKSEISAQRAMGANLEIEYNSLTSPTVIEKKASGSLQMSAPEEITHVNIK